MEPLLTAIAAEGVLLAGFIAGLVYANHRCDKRFKEAQRLGDERERRLLAAIERKMDR